MAVFSSDSEVIENATGQVLHLTCSVGGGGAVGSLVFSYSHHGVALRPRRGIPGDPGRVGHTVEVSFDSLRRAGSWEEYTRGRAVHIYPYLWVCVKHDDFF